MKIYLSNDDGYQARGIQTLYKDLEDQNITIIAPQIEKSSCGHGITVKNAFDVNEVKPKLYAVNGTPADCMMWAFDQLGKPDLVISGINHGANLAQDIYYSGTLAAAREAGLRGVPGIAISLNNLHDDQGFFEEASTVLKSILSSNLLSLMPKYTVLNINVPNVPLEQIQGFRVTSLGWRNYRARFNLLENGLYQFQGHLGEYDEKKGTDTFAIKNGYVSISFLSLPESTSLVSKEIISEVEKISI